MSATPEEASTVFHQWHQHISERNPDALARLYTDHATLESPLVAQLLRQQSGIVRGRTALDHFLEKTTQRRPEENELRSLRRADTFLFDGQRLIWEYPRQTPDGDQLDLVEVMELDGPRITNHRIYWGWYGIAHVARQ